MDRGLKNVDGLPRRGPLTDAAAARRLVGSVNALRGQNQRTLAGAEMSKKRLTCLFALGSLVVLATACSGAAAPPAGGGDAGTDVKYDVALKFYTDSADASDIGSDAEDATDTTDALADDVLPPVDTATAPDVPDVAPDVQCEPICGIHVCGDDGCGGTCGTCDAKTICSVGKCITDPKLGCAGLSLPPNWKGTFAGDMTFSILGLIPTNTSSKGDLAFSITCLNSKFLVNGTMSGTASKLNPFSLKISGTYDPTTKKVDATMSAGDVTVFFVVEYFFGGTILGTLDATNTFNGTWVMATTNMKLLGSATAGQIVPLTGAGTWTATGGP